MNRRLSFLVSLSVLGAATAAALPIACTPATAGVVAQAIPVIDNLVCELAADQANEPAFETFVCNAIDPKTKEARAFRIRVPRSPLAARIAAPPNDGGLPR